MATSETDTASGSAADDFAVPDVDTGDEATRKQMADGPARVAVGVMLVRALEAAGTTMEAIGADGVVSVLALSDPAWTDIALEYWRTSVRHGKRGDDGKRAGYWDAYGWAPQVPPQRGGEASGGDKFALCVAKGLHCVGLSADPSWLPDELVQAAGHRLILPSLTAADLREVAKKTLRQAPGRAPGRRAGRRADAEAAAACEAPRAGRGFLHPETSRPARTPGGRQTRRGRRKVPARGADLVSAGSDKVWVAACKMARHLCLAPPGRAPKEVRAFVSTHITATLASRRSSELQRRRSGRQTSATMSGPQHDRRGRHPWCPSRHVDARDGAGV